MKLSISNIAWDIDIEEEVFFTLKRNSIYYIDITLSKYFNNINLKKAKRIKICLNKFVVFSAMLIHGNGSNNKNLPRYSIDFGLIKKEKILGKKIKDHKHIAYSESGKYWEKLKLN